MASDVQNKIYGDPGIQSRQISVQAAAGVVTLSGDVTSDVERNAAANDAAAIDGVRTVINNLQVQQAQAIPPQAEAPPKPEPKRTARDKKTSPKPASRHHRNAEPEQPASDATLANSVPPVSSARTA